MTCPMSHSLQPGQEIKFTHPLSHCSPFTTGLSFSPLILRTQHVPSINGCDDVLVEDETSLGPKHLLTSINLQQFLKETAGKPGACDYTEQGVLTCHFLPRSQPPHDKRMDFFLLRPPTVLAVTQSLFFSLPLNTSQGGESKWLTAVFPVTRGNAKSFSISLPSKVSLDRDTAARGLFPS